jgi:Uma2 family endonuclease
MRRSPNPIANATLDSYFAAEEATEGKNEYYQGEIRSMVGASTNHNRIVVSLSSALDSVLESRHCEVFSSDVKLYVAEHDLATYPDLIIICGEPRYWAERQDTVTNPTVIMKVLSKSTRGYDTGKKFALYRALPTFQDYVLVEQERVHIDHYHKLADGRWLLTTYEHPEAMLVLESVNAEIMLSRIYRRVDWSLP